MSCFKCGRQGHMARASIVVRPAATQGASPSGGGMSCFYCGQQGHTRRFCPQLQSQSQLVGSSATQQTGASVVQPQYQTQTPPTLPVPQPSVASTSQAGSTAPRGRGQQQGSGLQQGKVFTLATTTSPPDPVVRGTFLLFSL